MRSVSVKVGVDLDRDVPHERRGTAAETWVMSEVVRCHPPDALPVLVVVPWLPAGRCVRAGALVANCAVLDQQRSPSPCPMQRYRW